MTDHSVFFESSPTSPTPHLTSLDLINSCDSFPYFSTSPETYTRLTSSYYHLLVVGHARTLGLLLPSVAAVFRGLSAWELDDSARTLTLMHGATQGERSAAVAATTAAMRATGHFKVLDGWRDELYAVYGEDGSVLFEVERAASVLLGVVTYGVHATVYVRDSADADGIRVWTPRRSRAKSTYPGMLDNSVAGGLSAGEEPIEALVREAGEEASLEAGVAREARATGTVTYFHVRDERAGGETRLLQPECQYCYDLEVGPDVMLRPGDDEVEGFELLSVAEVREAMGRGEFKPNCALVMLDFFVRHGVLTAENERDYAEVVSRLHRFLEFPMAKLGRR